MELNILNLPVFEAVIDIFAQSLEDDRIALEVREEYRTRYNEAIDPWRPPADSPAEISNNEYDHLQVQRDIMAVHELVLMRNWEQLRK